MTLLVVLAFRGAKARRSGVQGQPQLHNVFEAIVDYVRLCLKKQDAGPLSKMADKKPYHLNSGGENSKGSG